MRRSKTKKTAAWNAKAAMDAWRLGMKAVELWSAAGTTIMLRTWDCAANRGGKRKRNAEAKRMVDEKIQAAIEANAAWMNLGASTANPFLVAQKMMAPYHRRAKANARRLTRKR